MGPIGIPRDSKKAVIGDSKKGMTGALGTVESKAVLGLFALRVIPPHKSERVQAYMTHSRFHKKNVEFAVLLLNSLVAGRFVLKICTA